MQKHIKNLTTHQILQLRKEIVLGSIFLHDYENTLYIEPNEVRDFFDSYLDYCETIPNENGDLICDLTNNYLSELFKLANKQETLTEYFNTIEWGE